MTLERGIDPAVQRERSGGWTYSVVSCVIRDRELMPDPTKESLYWVIFSALSQSSTELTLLRSGAPRSSRAWGEGLEGGRNNS